MNSALDKGIFYTQVFSWRIFDLSIFQVGHWNMAYYLQKS